MTNLYEYYNTGDNADTAFAGSSWVAQTFTPSIDHRVLYVKLKLYRIGSPGTLIISIRATNGEGHPTGDDLCSGTTDGNTLTENTDGEWREITFDTGCNLFANTKYAIVIRAPDGSSPSHTLQWRCVWDGTYTKGNIEASTNSGEDWAGNLELDYMFEEWGERVRITPTDYPDYTDLMHIVGTDIMVAIDLQGSYIMMPVDIQAQYINLAIDIVAQTIGNIAVNIAAADIGNIAVDIKAQTIGNLTIDIEAQSVGMYLQPDWAAKEGEDKNFYGTGGDIATTLSIVVNYTPNGKTLFLVSASMSIWGHDAADRDKDQVCCLFIKIAGSTVFAVGGNGGASITFPKPLKLTTGQELGLYAGNYANHNCDLQVCGYGYEV